MEARTDLVPEEVCDICNILPEEFEGSGVVVLHRLGDVDDVQLFLEVPAWGGVGE